MIHLFPCWTIINGNKVSILKNTLFAVITFRRITAERRLKEGHLILESGNILRAALFWKYAANSAKEQKIYRLLFETGFVSFYCLYWNLFRVSSFPKCLGFFTIQSLEVVLMFPWIQNQFWLGRGRLWRYRMRGECGSCCVKRDISLKDLFVDSFKNTAINLYIF